MDILSVKFCYLKRAFWHLKRAFWHLKRAFWHLKEVLAFERSSGI